MFLDDIAPEIRLEILQLCSPKDLASLSRVHSSLHDVAERVLYTHIYFPAHPWDLVHVQRGKTHRGSMKTSTPWALKKHRSLLYTLSTSAWKTKMVKSLYIELHKHIRRGLIENGIRFILIKLSQLLKHMPNLVDFRIIYDSENDPSEGRLSEAIRFVFDPELKAIWRDRYLQARSFTTPYSMARTRSRSQRNHRRPA